MISKPDRVLMIALGFLAVFSTGCKKQDSDKQSQSSSIKVDKNGDLWAETRAVGTFNTKDSMVSIMGQEGLETFTIRFKKPVLNGNLTSFDATSLFVPSIGAASVSDFFDMDGTKDNRLRIYVTDNLKKRIAGEFYMYLKRDEKYGTGDTNVYKGKFDIQLEEVSF